MLPELRIIDPACGRGDFLLGILALVEALEGYMAARLGYAHDSGTALRRIAGTQLCGVEVQQATLAEAARRLRARTGMDGGLYLDDTLLPRTDRAREALAAASFDLVVGNPPYVRHEQIGDPLARSSARPYRAAILEAIAQRLRLCITADGRTSSIGVDGRSDLSALFLLHGISLLRRDGVLVCVLPTALLQARYGDGASAAVAASGREALVVESRSHRSFTGVDINTSIVVVTPGPRSNPNSGFRRVELEGRPEGGQAATIWAEASHSQRRKTTALPEGPRLVPLGSLGRMRYPIKTGLNRFFYPDAGTVATFGIEPRYLRPVLKSPREVECVSLKLESLRALAFVCGDDPDALLPGAARYVAWGSRQRTAGGIKWPEVPSLRARRHWFVLPLPARADVLCPRFFDRRLFFVLPQDAVIEDQTFYGLILAPEPEYQERRELIAALLTCSLTCLSLETHGRTGLGDGVRQYALCDMAALPVLDPSHVPEMLAGSLVEAFRAVARRRILPVEEEMRQADRVALDAVTAEALGVPARAMDAARSEVVERVDRRAVRARS